MMPGIDGYEVCRRLKEDKKLSNIPVIFISALNDSQTIVKALGYGGVDYITKPFHPEEVTARVKTHLKLYQQSKELQELNANLVESQEQLKKFASHLQTIREEERNLLGTEIHDKIGQILVALKIDMGIWRKKVLYKLENKISSEILDNFNELVNIVDNTISTARKITSNLKSDALEILGFIETSKLYCAEFESVYKINCCLETSITKLELDEKQKTGLYKILQYILLKTQKQSNASSVKVTMSIENNMFIMEIKDNGKLINEDLNIGNETFETLSINERVQLLNGKLFIKTEVDGTNLLRFEMPYF
jgi:signal transduction histidine kinase